MMPVTKYVAQWIGSMQKRLMKAKDERVEINNEVLGSMKVIKLQAWEESFQKRILSLREVELNQLFWYMMGSALSIMLWSSVPLLVSLSTFAAYTVSFSLNEQICFVCNLPYFFSPCIFLLL
jgi:hypothetical protein